MMAQLRARADEDVSATGVNESNKKARAGLGGVLRERKVVDLVRAKRRLVEVPYTATVAHTANALLAARVSAVAVAAPPGHWIGAGGSMILESDPATGAVRKHYIGMVNMLDILAHIAEASDDAEADDEEEVDLDRRMAVPVSSVIGHSLEGLTLWTLHPNTSVLDCMETFSKGVHRALVPLESSADNVVAVELVESAPGYRMLTQMDVVRFLLSHCAELKDVLSRELGAVNETVLAVSSGTKVIDAVKAMRAASLTAVPVVNAAVVDADAPLLQDVSEFRGQDPRSNKFKTKVAEYRARNNRPATDGTVDTGITPLDDEVNAQQQLLVTCSPESTLGEAVEAAASRHVHRLWAVDEAGLLVGVVSLTDLLRERHRIVSS